VQIGQRGIIAAGALSANTSEISDARSQLYDFDQGEQEWMRSFGAICFT
jgi:hypothetical protein